MDKVKGKAESHWMGEECLDDDPAMRPTIATVCEQERVFT